MGTMSASKTSMVTGHTLSKHDSVLIDDVTLYRKAVGSLQYLAQTRPDIAFAVGKLSQFLSAPMLLQWKAVKHLLRYLQGTINLGLHIKKSSCLDLVAYSDVDWASCLDDRRSTGGYLVYYGDSLVAWSSKKQSVVARSSAESEYKALAHTSSEILWLHSLFAELGIHHHLPSVIWRDNVSAAALASNPIFHARTKHFEVGLHFV